jgi:hypothetical protein
MSTTVDIRVKCQISGSHSSDYKDYNLLGCDTMYCDLYSLTPLRQIMHPSSRLKNTPCKQNSVYPVYSSVLMMKVLRLSETSVRLTKLHSITYWITAVLVRNLFKSDCNHWLPLSQAREETDLITIQNYTRLQIS